MGNRKRKFWEISKLYVLKDLLTLVVIFIQVYRWNSQKEKMKQNQLDDCKVKILESQGEFDILTKDSVLNIEKRALRDVTNIRNVT